MSTALPLQPDLPLWGANEEPPIRSGEARRILLGDRIVPYVLRRSRRRTIGLVVDRTGLRVGAPQRATHKEVETLIVRHAEWVIEKLGEWVGCDLRPRIRVVDGATVPVLGQPCTIRLDAAASRSQWNGDILRLPMRSDTQPAAALEKALRTRAREFFIGRMTHFAAVMKLEVPRLAMSSARTRWGSCNRDTGIRLNWRLIHCAPHLVDYVVVHELAHLRQMNHSPRFWREVEIVLPRYRDARRELRELSERLPQLD